MNKLVILLVLTYIGSACEPLEPVADPQQAAIKPQTPKVNAEQPRPSPPFTHEGDTEYQNGLTAMLSTSPLLGVKLVTSLYRFGYLSGLQEAAFFQANIDSRLSENGCLKGALIAENYAGKSVCSAYRHAELDGYSPQGKMFSKDRLTVAQQVAQYGGDVNIQVTIFTVGYNMGFANQWESVDQEVRAEKVTYDGCTLGLRTDPPPSPAQAAIFSHKCGEEALVIRNADTTRNMKCLLVTTQGNGDLSGTAFKAGCDSKK